MDKIFLIGFRTVGKSTVGRLLAEKLGWSFRDLDDRIEETEGISISAMVARYGWEYFRDRELQALEEAFSSQKPLVIACGGGAVLHEDFWRKISAHADAFIVWLKADTETVLQRILNDARSADQRPALLPGMALEEEIRKTMAEREPLYRKRAHVEIDAGKESPDVIVMKLLETLQRIDGKEVQ